MKYVKGKRDMAKTNKKLRGKAKKTRKKEEKEYVVSNHMKFLKNMSVRLKIMIPIALLAILLVSSCAVSIYDLGRMMSASSKISDYFKIFQIWNAFILTLSQCRNWHLHIALQRKRK